MVTACYNVIVIAKIIRNNVTKMRELVDIFSGSITDEKRTVLEIGVQHLHLHGRTTRQLLLIALKVIQNL